MDEKKGRRKLTQLNMLHVGTVGILLKAKQIGILPTIREDLTQLRTRGFSISQPVIDAVLQQAGET
jgi:predicted nucleic acid-binding protein